MDQSPSHPVKPGTVPPGLRLRAQGQLRLTGPATSLACAMPVSFWALYLTGELEFFNGYLERYSGAPLGADPRRALAAIVHPEDEAVLEMQLRAEPPQPETLPYGHQETHPALVRLRRGKDGAFRRHLVQRFFQPVPGPEDGYWLGSFTDVEDQPEDWPTFLQNISGPGSAPQETESEPSAAVEAPAQTRNPRDSAQNHLVQNPNYPSAGAQLAESIRYFWGFNRWNSGASDASGLLPACQGDPPPHTPGIIYQFRLRADGSVDFPFVSSGSKVLFGLEPGEIEADANTLLNLIPPNEFGSFCSSMLQSAENLSPWQWEGWINLPGGKRRWICCSAVPGCRDENTIVWDGLLVDVTAGKRAEEQAELQQRQLEQANELLREANRQLDILASHDALTGLKNRRYFEERLRDELARATRLKTPISLLFLDVDHFKQYNDNHGHSAGDQVLTAVGELISRSIRDMDCGARYGGEEFGIILPASQHEDALATAERIRRTIEAHDWPHSPITVSVGVATTCGEIQSGEFVEHADRALYAAKKSGRNRVCCQTNLPPGP